MQNIILSIITLENVNDSQKLTLIKGIREKLNDSKGINDKVENALGLCGEFQSNMDDLQNQINDLESNLEDLQHDFSNFEDNNFEDLEPRIYDLEKESDELKDKIEDLRTSFNFVANSIETESPLSIAEELDFLIKLLIKKVSLMKKK